MNKLLYAIKSLLVVIVVLWAVDVLVNLHLWQETLLGNLVYGTTRDYIGLLLLEIQIAAGLVLVSAALAAGLTWLLRSRWLHEFEWRWQAPPVVS